MNKSFKFLLSFVLLSWAFALNASIAQDTTRVKEQKQLQTQEKEQKQEQLKVQEQQQLQEDQQIKNQIKQEQKFVDEDGDGFNDNAADDDGDGIPNMLDPDYQKQIRENEGKFVDLDGDGINDNLVRSQNREGTKSIGPKHQTKNQGNPTQTEKGTQTQTGKNKKGKNK